MKILRRFQATYEKTARRQDCHQTLSHKFLFLPTQAVIAFAVIIWPATQ
jgi:hypothetical protein